MRIAPCITLKIMKNKNIFAKMIFANILLKNDKERGRIIVKGGIVKWKRYQL